MIIGICLVLSAVIGVYAYSTVKQPMHGQPLQEIGLAEVDCSAEAGIANHPVCVIKKLAVHFKILIVPAL